VTAAADSAELRELEERGAYTELVAGLRDRLAADRRVMTDPYVKQWCGRRWRNLFISAAADDPAAVGEATRRLSLPGTDISLRTGRDDRPDRQKLAERFLRRNSDEWELEMPEAAAGVENGTMVFCPGLINSMLPMRAFASAFPAVAEKHGWRVLCADAHPMRGCEANVADLAATIEHGLGLDAGCAPIAEQEAEQPGDVFLLGYSKGIPDALTMLVERPELAPRVKALYSWGGAFGGSFLADDIYDSIKELDLPLGGGIGDALATIVKTVFPIVRLDGISERLDEYDVKGAIRDLTTPVRERFLAEHAEEIDALDIPIFNITAATTALEVPFFQVQGYMEVARRDRDNDMQVTQDQARMTTPMATDLAVLHAHHWDISYDPFPVHTRLGSPNLDHPFPREAAIIAIFQLTAELGLIS
jgi:hypothetical protein